MKIPKTFRMEKDLEKKIQDLLKGKVTDMWDSEGHDFTKKLEQYFILRDNGNKDIVIIADNNPENRLGFAMNTIKRIIHEYKENSETFSYNEWYISNNYKFLPHENDVTHMLNVSKYQNEIRFMYMSKEIFMEMIKDCDLSHHLNKSYIILI